MTYAAQYVRRVNAAPKGRQNYVLEELDNGSGLEYEVEANDDMRVTFGQGGSQCVLRTTYGPRWEAHVHARESGVHPDYVEATV